MTNWPLGGEGEIDSGHPWPSPLALARGALRAPALARLSFRVYNVDTIKEIEPMKAVIRKWGNSPALRLPTAVLKEAGYQLEQKVDLVVSRGRIIIQPSKKIEYDLDALVNGINAGNTHDEVNFGRPVGNEAL